MKFYKVTSILGLILAIVLVPISINASRELETDFPNKNIEETSKQKINSISESSNGVEYYISSKNASIYNTDNDSENFISTIENDMTSEDDIVSVAVIESTESVTDEGTLSDILEASSESSTEDNTIIENLDEDVEEDDEKEDDVEEDSDNKEIEIEEDNNDDVIIEKSNIENVEEDSDEIEVLSESDDEESESIIIEDYQTEEEDEEEDNEEDSIDEEKDEVDESASINDENDNSDENNVTKTITVYGDKRKSYESYTSLTSKSSKQYKLQQMATTGEDGGRMIDGRYLVATGSAISHNIGQAIDVVLNNGTVIPCIVGDAKDDRHTDTSNIVGLDGSVIEFIVDSTELDSEVKHQGNMDLANDGWDSRIASITVLDKIY